MTTSKLNKYWTLIAILLVAIIAIGSIVVWSKYSRSQPIEISTPSVQELQGEICIGGAVINPGFYPLRAMDRIEDIIQAAGGTSSNADLSELKLKLYILEMGEEQEPQKIDINQAKVWLLKALPEIGETLAQRIVEYRQRNGPFRNTNELIKVAGIGTTTYEKIKHLITVAD